MLHKCQRDHTTEVQLSNYKATIVTMWPPTISESHTEQRASYRWPQNKSIAIKEKIMLSMRACQDCKCSLKHSEDCNLNLITVGKLNTEVNSYVPF
jgi:hypothetical protein